MKKIQELMTAHVITAAASDTVTHARELLAYYRFSALPIVDHKGRPVGVVTSTDLMPETASGVPLSEVMTRRIYTVPDFADACVAACVMLQRRCHHVLVVDGKRRLVGIISSFDLLRLIKDGLTGEQVQEQAPERSGSDEVPAEGSGPRRLLTAAEARDLTQVEIQRLVLSETQDPCETTLGRLPRPTTQRLPQQCA